MSDVPEGYYLGPNKEILLEFRRQPDISFVQKPKVSRKKPGSFKRNRVLLAERFGMLCHYCDCLMVMPVSGATKHKPNTATIEHILPTHHGGPNAFDNLALVCNKCNNDRGNDLDSPCKCERCLLAYSLYYRR